MTGLLWAFLFLALGGGIVLAYTPQQSFGLYAAGCLGVAYGVGLLISWFLSEVW